jgi:hypothetical protein
MKKRTVSKFAKRRRMAFLMAIVIILLIIICISNKDKEHVVPEVMSLLYNNEIINLEKEMYVDNNIIYMSKEDVKKIFDDTIYYNEAEKELITTFNTHIALLKVNESFMVLNDSNVELKGMLTEKNNTVYLPINDLDILYDLEIEYSKEYNRAIFSSTTDEKKQSITLKKAYVYEKPSKFSKKVEKLEMSEYVVVLSTDRKYKKIRTPNGNIGYIKESKISNEETKREKMVETALNVNIVKDADDIFKTYDNSILSKEKQNVVIPTFFTLDSESKILDKTNSKTSNFENYISWVNENNMQLWATCTNNSTISEDLLTYHQRNAVINEIYQKLMSYQFQGVNINFEKIDDVNSFYRFLIELKPKLKESGLKLAVTYNSYLDKNKIRKIADYVIEE